MPPLSLHIASTQSDEHVNYVQLHIAIDEAEKLPSKQCGIAKRNLVIRAGLPAEFSEEEIRSIDVSKHPDVSAFAEVLGRYLASIRLEVDQIRLKAKIVRFEWLWSRIDDDREALLNDSAFEPVFSRYSDRYYVFIQALGPDADREAGYIHRFLKGITPENASLSVYRAQRHVNAIKRIHPLRRNMINVGRLEQSVFQVMQVYTAFTDPEKRILMDFSGTNPPLEGLGVDVVASLLRKQIIRSHCAMAGASQNYEDFKAIWEKLIKSPRMATALVDRPELVEINAARYARPKKKTKIDKQTAPLQESLKAEDLKCFFNNRVSFTYEGKLIQGMLETVFGGAVVVTGDDGSEVTYSLSKMENLSRTQNLICCDSSNEDEDENSESAGQLRTAALYAAQSVQKALMQQDVVAANRHLSAALKDYRKLVISGEVDESISLAIRDAMKSCREATR